MRRRARPERHDPTDACAGVHCYSHNVDERVPGTVYAACPECFHVFRWAGSLWWDRLRLAWRLRMGLSYWLVRPRSVNVCPHCTHDL